MKSTTFFAFGVTFALLFSTAAHSEGQPTTIDPTGLVGKTITPKALPKGTDVMLKTFGNDYYSCGGERVDGFGEGGGYSILRKGVRSSCTNGKIVVALTRITNNGATTEFLDTITVEWPKGYALATSACKGADVVLTKAEDKQVRTKHLSAWKVESGHFVALPNLTGIKCENESYGV